MGRTGRLLILVVVLATASTSAAWLAAASQPASRSTEELPPDVLSQLSSIEDFTYDFDHPGYYALLRFVKQSRFAPGFGCLPIAVDDWRTLVERPKDFRGLPVTIEGTVGRNKDPYVHPRYPELGQVWQVELRRPDQAISCTVVFTSDVSDLPLGADIRVTGYFFKINRYPTRGGQPGLSALLVAPGPTQISRVRSQAVFAPDWRWLSAALVVGLAATLFLLWRSRRIARHELRTLRAQHEAPLNLADDLAEWAARELPEQERPDERAGR